MTRVCAADAADFAWLQERTSCGMTGNFRAIKAIDEAGRILGMVGYDRWTPNSVEMHVALDTPVAARALCGPALSYPFDECDVGMVRGVIQSGNRRSLRLAQRMGFVEVSRCRDGWARGVDLVFLELRRENYTARNQQRKAA